MLESIKEDRRLSFKHWRYRILHWCFNVNNPDPKNLWSTGMPIFLYTHYCPLFHLTNLIALLSPLIFLIKLICLLAKVFIGALASIDLSWIGNLMKKIPKRKEKKSVITKEYERRLFLEYLSEWDGTFLSMESRYSYKFIILTVDERETLYNEYYPQVVAMREKDKKRKELMRERLIFWTRFSQTFIKFGLNAFYVCLALLVLYLGYLAVFPVIDALSWLYNAVVWLFTDVGSLTVFFTVCKMFFYGLLIFSFFYVTFRLGFMQKFCEGCIKYASYLAPPFYLFVVLGNWISRGCSNVKEFVAMFYEENCPPIILISEDEAIVTKEEN